MSNATAATVIETGYVSVTTTSGVTVAKNYAKAGEKLTVTAENITAGYNVTVTYTDGTKAGLTVKGSNDTAAAADVKLTIVPEKDIEITAVASAAKPAAVTYTVPETKTEGGLTFTWALDQTAGFVGDTFTGTLTVTGAGTKSVALKLGSTAVTNWNTIDAVKFGADTTNANTLTLTGVSYGTDTATFRFSFTAADDTLTASYT